MTNYFAPQRGPHPRGRSDTAGPAHSHTRGPSTAHRHTEAAEPSPWTPTSQPLPGPVTNRGSRSRRASPAGGRRALWLPCLTTFPPAPTRLRLPAPHEGEPSGTRRRCPLHDLRVPARSDEEQTVRPEGPRTQQWPPGGLPAGPVAKKPPASAADTRSTPGRQALAWESPWTESLAGRVHGVAESDTT